MCSISGEPRREEYTICTAVAADAVFTVRTGLMSQAEAVLLWETLQVTGLGRCLRRVLIRADSGGGPHEFLKWLITKSQDSRHREIVYAGLGWDLTS